MPDYTISIKQIDKMKHCIGFEISKVKRGKYVAYRNYYTMPDINSEWEELVNKGLAMRDKYIHGCGTNPQIYSLTVEGINLVQSITGVKISILD